MLPADQNFRKQMNEEFGLLANVLKEEAAKRSLYYLPNPGNWGDGVIRSATIKFFRDINLEFEELTGSSIKKLTRNWTSRPLSMFKRRTVIYGGGGAWCRLWNHSINKIKPFSNRNFNIIVLPSTFELTCSIPNTVFFCRDLFESKHNMPDAVFCHDMVFYLDGHIHTRGKGLGRGYFFRTDNESAKILQIPDQNIDISQKGTHKSDMVPFTDQIDEFSVIYTDRLHVAIIECLLGKEVHLYPGSYFKNRAVYMSSMKSYFENIYFHQDFDLLPR